MAKEKDKKQKSPKEAAKLFEGIVKAAVSGNPKPKKKSEKQK